MRTADVLDLIDQALADGSVSPDAVRCNAVGVTPETPTEPRRLDLLQIAADYVTRGARHGSLSMLMRRFSQEHRVPLTFDGARLLLVELFAAGVVGPVDPVKHEYPVLMTQEQAGAALASRPVSEVWATVYECPQCCRVSPWTNGRSVRAGDDVDEFWCPTCGTESPLVACAAITA